DGDAEPLRIARQVDALIGREQDAAFDTDRFVQQQRRRSDEDGAPTTDRSACELVLHPILRRGLNEKPKVGFTGSGPKCRRAVAVHDSRQLGAAEAIPGAVEVMLNPATD